MDLNTSLIADLYALNQIIREILIENGSPVEFGQPLFVIS